MAGYLGNSGFTAPQNSNTNQTPGIMGSSTYQVQNYGIDPNAFTNPIPTSQVAGGFTTGQNQLLTAAGGPAPTIDNTGGAGQLGVANLATGIATGAVPGAAQTAAALQGTQEQQQALSAMGSARGTANPALANYELGVNAGNIRNTVAQNSVTGAANQQAAMLGQASTAFSAIQQQAIQQAQLQGQQLGLQGSELQNYINNNATQIANTMTASQAGQQLGVQQNLGLNQVQQQAQANAAGHSLGADITNTAGAVIGGLSKASDRKLKKNIKPARATIEKFLASVV